MKRVIFILFSVSLAFVSYAQSTAPDNIVGVWKSSSNDVMVKIDGIGGQYQGRIVWLDGESASQPMLDTKNPEERLRKMPLKGNRIIQKLSFNTSTNQWEKGTYYQFKEGKTYNCLIQMSGNDKIIITRYTGSPDQGSKETWTRQK